MKSILLILAFFCIHFHMNGQNFYHDTITNQYVTEIYLTDSASEIFNQHLKMHIDVTDRGDSVQGASFTITMYSVKKTNPSIVFSTVASISRAYYNAWDANDDKVTYQMAAIGIKGQNIYIIFK